MEQDCFEGLVDARVIKTCSTVHGNPKSITMFINPFGGPSREQNESSTHPRQQPYTWYLQNISGIALFLRNTKYYNLSTWISFRIVPLCHYKLLPANVKVLETFLKAILWKTFQLCCHILNGVSGVTKAPALQCWFKLREHVKISCSQVRWVWAMLQCWHVFLR